MHPIPVLKFDDFVAADGDQLTTTSRQVAQVFEKRHDHVLRSIRELLAELPPERRLNFGEASYEVRQHHGGTATYGCYTITRDGFTLLAMGFTGKKAPDLQRRRGGSALNADPYGQAVARHLWQ